jgi:hypothetical protein
MSLYCISFPEAGWSTTFIIGVFFQWLLPKAMALLELPIFQKSLWDKFMGERLRGAQVRLCEGFSCEMMLHPGEANAVLL